MTITPTPVAPADTTVAYIRRKVRKLTTSSGESIDLLSTADLDPVYQ